MHVCPIADFLHCCIWAFKLKALEEGRGGTVLGPSLYVVSFFTQGKVMVQEILQGAQMFLTVKSWVPSTWKKYLVFPVAQRQKLVACSTQVLLEHSPAGQVESFDGLEAELQSLLVLLAPKPEISSGIMGD